MPGKLISTVAVFGRCAMAQDEQLVFAFAHDFTHDQGAGGDLSLAMRLRLGRLKFGEELSAQQAAVDQAWQRVERAVSAFAHIQAAPGR